MSIITQLVEKMEPALDPGLPVSEPLICTFLPLELFPSPPDLSESCPWLTHYSDGITGREFWGPVQLILISTFSALALHLQSKVLHIAIDFFLIFHCSLIASYMPSWLPTQSLFLDNFFSHFSHCTMGTTSTQQMPVEQLL